MSVNCLMRVTTATIVFFSLLSCSNAISAVDVLKKGAGVGLHSADSRQITFVMSDDETLVWENLRGEWVFVNYWAEWCDPCYDEIPELNALDKTPGVTVLGVNFDGKRGEALRKVMSEMNVEFNVFQDVFHQDPGQILGWDRPLAMPATMVVTPDGELKEARFGEQSKEELLEATR